MKYSRVCQNCLAHSDEEERICPECGTVKYDKLRQGSFYGSAIKYFADKLPNLENAEIYVGFVINTLLMLGAVIILDPLLEASELLWILFLLYTIQGVIKAISLKVTRIRRMHIYTRRIIFFYLGSGLGNFFSYVGKIHSYYPGEFFHPDMLAAELLNNNYLILIGGIAGLLTLRMSVYIFNLVR
jgi:hypothetical protein